MGLVRIIRETGFVYKLEIIIYQKILAYNELSKSIFTSTILISNIQSDTNTYEYD
jgi:hypothetical protein